MIDKKAKLEGKARKLIKREQDMGSTPEQFSKEYSFAIRITPTSLRGW